MRWNRHKVQMGVSHACVPAGAAVHRHVPLDANKPRKRLFLKTGFLLIAPPRLTADLWTLAQRTPSLAADDRIRAAHLMDGPPGLARRMHQLRHKLPMGTLF